jgi:hypothetical protein
MRRQATAREPAFGSDSFLDVTANLVGVLIILIVLVGLRTTKSPARVVAADAELDRRIDQVRGEVGALRLQRDELAGKLADLRHKQSASATAVAALETHDQRVADSAHELREQVAERQERAEDQSHELADARARLELDQLRAGPAAPRQLVYRSPLSRPVEAGEIHFEVRAGRATFIDLNGLIELARAKSEGLERQLRETGGVTTEVGPVGAFRLGLTVVREELPLRESALHGNVWFWNVRFRTRAEWKLLPVFDPRGEEPDQALTGRSHFESVLARYSPNKYAVTLWTYPDSFAAFRRLRDHLHDRGYSVAARPMPAGAQIRGSPDGYQSLVQ